MKGGARESKSIKFFFNLLQLAEEHGVKFMETSAKSGLNVETVCLLIHSPTCNCVANK